MGKAYRNGLIKRKEMDNVVIGYVIGAGGLIFGIYSYFTSGVLADKTKIITHDIEIKHLKDEIADMKEDIEDLQEWYNKGRNN